MASSSAVFLSKSSSSWFVFLLYFSMHACISSSARNIPITNAASLKNCKHAASKNIGHQHDSQCSGIVPVKFDALFGSEAKEEEHAITKSGRKVVESSSRMNFNKPTKTEVSRGSGAAKGKEEVVGLENNNGHEDIYEMDYHRPHHNSPIHNK